MKNFILTLSCIVALVLYTLTLRGSLGNPTPHQIEFEYASNGHAFETSQERSRYAMLLSLYHDRSFAIDNFASMGTPDIGYIKGHFYSFFPPGASIVAYPFFLLGQKFQVAQMAVFSVITIFALATLALLVHFAQWLKLHWSAALFSALSFGFATNAWGYSVTFYAHVISAFLLLSATYVALRFEKRPGLSAISTFIFYALGVFIDFPNLFIFFPVALFAGWRFFNMRTTETHTALSFRWSILLGPIIFVLLMSGYGYYNFIHFGDPMKLSNTIPRVKDLKDVDQSRPESGREAVSALNTRNMLEGFTSFTISHDRGILIYSPVVVLAFLGLGVLPKKKRHIEVLLLTVPLTCLTLYCMFGDPYGGWAFGSRYMLATFPELALLAAIGLNRFSKMWQRVGLRVLYSLVFAYSAAISALAPLTTNVIPPFVEAQHIGLASDYRINWQMLQRSELNSFVYNHVLQASIPGVWYYALVVSIVIGAGLLLIWWPRTKGEQA